MSPVRSLLEKTVSPSAPFERLLIANRGAIACRIIRTLRTMGISPVVLYADADMASLHVQQADIAVSLGSGGASDTYLQAERIIEIARETGAGAIHPGYGFLSENVEFAERCEDAGIAFVGPTPNQLRAFGLKHRARALAQAHGLPVLEGTPLLPTLQDALHEAGRIGYPVMLKSTAGGGGIGMRVCWSDDEVSGIFDAVRQLGENNFRDSGVFLEKYIERARHLEVQIFGDGEGGVISLGVRDCSVQRRNQKVIEETPAPNLPEGVAEALCDAAVRLGKAVNYRSAGTVEFVYDSHAEKFYFLEVNTRLQVEHGVTEQVWGVDLVRWMIQLAAGTLPPLSSLKASHFPTGHAVQARIYAEDPGKNFQPCPGLLTQVVFPDADWDKLRIDTWIEAGIEISPFFDPMAGKIIAHGVSRGEAITLLEEALTKTKIYGVETNIAYLRQILLDKIFLSGAPWTRYLENLAYKAATFEVITAGTQTTIQDFPGRIGYWAVGVPPSGPMDSRAFRLGNALLGNPPDAAGIEIVLTGPILLFNVDIVAVVTGAEIEIEIDSTPREMNTTFRIRAGETLRLGSIVSQGARAMLCLQGGIEVPPYLGSRATFTFGKFGGHAGRILQTGDILHLFPSARSSGNNVLPLALRNQLTEIRTLRVIYGPHAAPEYFTPSYVDTFFDAEWTVHFNSNRSGIRLVGPKPDWVRESGGEAGLHPSNIHDNPYAIGAVDFTGDMPVILGPDGPSLGGFVCLVTVIEADLWQLGQLRAGDHVRFVPVDLDTARRLAVATEMEIATLSPHLVEWHPERPRSPIVLTLGEGDQRLVARLSGDCSLLLEIGDAKLDIALRFRVHALMQAFETENLSGAPDDVPDGIIDLTPGIRSLQIHYRPEILPLSDLLDRTARLWRMVVTRADLRVASRIVHLPLSWDDPECQRAIDKYMTTVRKDAPWCPSNIDFIRRINGLKSADCVREIVFKAYYLVMGLGDVYLGAPVATPLDPRHRLITTKYNPARTWTAENSVGIGGAYLCVYGMEGPGGYQFVGRTLQMWARYIIPTVFEGKPWLLRFFDQIRFFPVSSGELESIRRDFPLGRYEPRIERTELSLADYQAFLKQEAGSIASFRARQRDAFEAERQRWVETGQNHFESDETDPGGPIEVALSEGEVAVESTITGNVWQVLVKAGDRVCQGQTVAVLESMKIEFALSSPSEGVVLSVNVSPGQLVTAGQCVVVLERT